MSAHKMILTVLVTGLVEAVAKDETPEEGGCDISAGMIGPHASAWLRSVAATICDNMEFRCWEVVNESLMTSHYIYQEKDLASFGKDYKVTPLFKMKK